MSQVILLHIDIDAFFAAVEQRNNPHLRGKPVIVGGSPNSRGVVATCSYEARAYGVHSAMPAAEAYRKCPHAIFVRGSYGAYTHASEQVLDIVRRYSPRVDAASIDEARVDLTGICRDYSDAIELARRAKAEIAREQGLTCSAGIGPNRLIAKIASGMQKPDGLTSVPPDQIEKILYPLSVSRIWGVGPVTYQRLRSYGVETIADLVRLKASMPSAEVTRLVDSLLNFNPAEEFSPTDDDDFEHGEKSISHGQTLAADISNPALVDAMILYLADKVVMRMQRHGFLARTLSLRLRYSDFRTITRDVTIPEATDDYDLICSKVRELVPRRQVRQKKVRLVGVRVSHLTPTLVSRQVDLFDDGQVRRRRQLAGAVRQLRDRFGDKVIFRATTLLAPN